MRFLARLIAVVLTLSLASSGALSAMPLVWCFGNDGHRAVESLLHQHAAQSADADIGQNTEGSHGGPCTDWQLLSAAGPLAQAADQAPKDVTGVLAHPPLRVLIALAPPLTGEFWGRAERCKPELRLRGLGSVVLRN